MAPVEPNGVEDPTTVDDTAALELAIGVDNSGRYAPDR
jgi:hypothetical protein